MRLAAVLVHLFTALGAVCALLAALAVIERQWELAFVWLGVAMIIDGVDGPLARRVGVTTHLPRFSGERLDLVIDYLTYVFVPALALLGAGRLAGTTGLLAVAAILVSSLFHFSDLESKSEDHCFVGFPAIWNIVALYVFALGLGPDATTALVAICVALTFVPLRWIHPVRVEALRPLTGLVVLAWSAAAVITVWQGFPAAGLVQAVLLAAAAYGVGLSVLWRWLAGPA